MTVVVGYVPNQTGTLALREAAAQARTRRHDVVVVNVLGPHNFLSPTAADEHDLDAVAALLNDEGVVSSQRQVRTERSAAHVILEVSADVHASLIVLGMHQRSWLAKKALGSTLRTVAMAAPCPLLVVPDVDHQLNDVEMQRVVWPAFEI